MPALNLFIDKLITSYSSGAVHVSGQAVGLTTEHEMGPGVVLPITEIDRAHFVMIEEGKSLFSYWETIRLNLGEPVAKRVPDLIERFANSEAAAFCHERTLNIIAAPANRMEFLAFAEPHAAAEHPMALRLDVGFSKVSKAGFPTLDAWLRGTELAFGGSFSMRPSAPGALQLIAYRPMKQL